MIDGATSKPFSAQSFPLKEYSTSYKQEIITESQKSYGKQKMKMEDEIFSKQKTLLTGGEKSQHCLAITARVSRINYSLFQ